jgi:hypothetical protein
MNINNSAWVWDMSEDLVVVEAIPSNKEMTRITIQDKNQRNNEHTLCFASTKDFREFAKLVALRALELEGEEFSREQKEVSEKGEKL